MSAPPANFAPGKTLDGRPMSVYQQPTRAFPALRGGVSASVAVIGAGFTGLSTALHLCERGIDVVVLDARQPGWGASGRNGGQVNAGFKHDPDEVEAVYGLERGRRLVALSAGAPAEVFGLVERYGIACDARRSGTIRVVTATADAEAMRSAAEQWQRRGAPVEFLDAARLAELIGTHQYVAGTIDRRGGHLDPAAYSSGLADAAARIGAAIHGDSPVVGLRRVGERWELTTAGGTVLADRVVAATNGYSGPLLPTMRDSVVPVYSAVTATEPLAPELLRTILPGGEVVYESSYGVYYFRVDAGSRLLMGGPSPLRDTARPADYRHLQDYARRLYPTLGDVAWTHSWNGQLAVSRGRQPRLDVMAPGLIAAFGYSGRGIAMATAFGRIAADWVTGASEQDLDVPLTTPHPMAGRRFWKLAVTARRLYGALHDRVRR